MVNALSQVSDAVIATDHAHRITYWNKSAEQLYRFTPQEVRGRAIEDVYHHRWLKPLEIESSGKGTTVRAILPLSERHS
jgi:PAS domain S-box-containing protein